MRIWLAAAALTFPLMLGAQDFKIGDGGYFNNKGVDVMVFYDFYPEGHQGGVCLIMNGRRVATNGDLRFEATPGQWQPIPRRLGREIRDGEIVATLAYPDSSRHLTSKNPIIYPDAQLQYTVSVKAVGDHLEVCVDLDRPIPDFLVGKAGFNLEFFPGSLFGKPWMMDGKTGIYPTQPNSPLLTTEPNYRHAGDFHPAGKPKMDLERYVGDPKVFNPVIGDDIIAAPYAVGRKFISRPDDPYSKVTIETLTSDLKLYDGRMNHNNGWFVLRSEIPAGATKGAVKWIITPTVVEDWVYKPVIHTSQVGYLPAQPKVAILELDARTPAKDVAKLMKIDGDGEKPVRIIAPRRWGRFLRFNYAHLDFSDVTEPGLYRIRYGESLSSIFRIDPDVFERGVWQPVIEYFLPNQMCHMRVNEKYRVWHDACHMDDARMALNQNGFDNYKQEPGLSPYPEGAQVPGLAIGGWHDAGDLDVRIESQATESYFLAMTYEQFRPEIDVTSIDQHARVTEIHQPDGRNDILQQAENGVLSVVAAYNALGRPYRGIICSRLRQYVILGDAAAATDGITGNDDDRWVYTEDNPARDLQTSAYLAGTARVLRGFNDTLARRCLEIAEELFARTPAVRGGDGTEKIFPAAELFLTTGKPVYHDYILANKDAAVGNVASTGWYLAKIAKTWEQGVSRREKAFAKAFRSALEAYRKELDRKVAENPFGVPYNPTIWGDGWNILGFGYKHYFLTTEYPDIFGPDPMVDALNFILGCHPGENLASFASGVGTKSVTTAYGTNRADWSFIPGGVVSGTSIIRPDFPELLDFPFLWQQAEYVLAGTTSRFMFLVLATERLLKNRNIEVVAETPRLVF